MSIYDTNMKGSRSQAYSEIGLSTHAPYDGGFRCHGCVRNQPLTQTWIYHSSGRLKYNIIPREEYFPLPNIIIPSISSPWHIPNSWIRHKRPRNISSSYIIHLRLRNFSPTEKKYGSFSGLSAIHVDISPLSIFFDLLASWLASVNMIYE